jgi:lysozyme
MEFPMNISPQGLAMIKQFEGFSLKAYLDPVQIPTIGYGTIAIHGRPVKMGMVITEAQASEYLLADLQKFEDAVNQAVNVPLTQEQFDALVSFTYNLGPGNLRASTLLKMINAGRLEEAQPQFLRWNRAGGKVFKGLTRRRLAEAALFGPRSASELIRMYRLVV